MERRDFLKLMGVSAGAVGAAAAPSLARTGMAAVPAPALRQQTADEMDLHHQQGIQMFLDNVGKEENFWRKPLEFTMDGDVKVFELTCTEMDWDTGGGVMFPAMAYNGMVPGPEIRITEGDQCRVLVTNQMTQSTSVHWHGMYVPNNMDGVPYITQEPIKPGETFAYEFTARNAGSHMYHSHHNSAEQVSRGQLGAIIVEPKDKSREPEVAADFSFILNDSTLGFTINGRGFPYTQPVTAKVGDKIRIRYFNEGFMIHPMHLHGIPQQVFAKDGWYLPVPYMVDTLLIAPGERYDVLVNCTEPGIWAYHCHILTHAESANGMFGMVTVLIVQ